MSKKSIFAYMTLSLLATCYVAAQLPRDRDAHQDTYQHVQSSDRQSMQAASGPSSYDPSFLKSAKRGPVVFEGGYQTDSRDGGRPVALIAAALGVTADQFRDAFRSVTPARDGSPSQTQVHANKRVLLDALGKHGVTNERLDEVSDYYRYRPQSETLWRHKTAQAVAVIENDRVTGIRILDGGAGFLNPPRARIAGFPDLKIDVQLAFGADLKTNGRIISMKLIE